MLRGVGAAFLSNKDIKDASALLHRDIEAEAKWTCIEIISAVERGMCSILSAINAWADGAVKVREEVSLGFDLSHSKLDLANSTLSTTSSMVDSNSRTLNANTQTLNSHTSQLSTISVRLATIESIVVQSSSSVDKVGVVTRTSRFGYPTPRTSYSLSTTLSTSRFGYPTPTPTYDGATSTELSVRRTSSTDIDVFTVARDAMVVFERFTSTQVTGEIRVPLACSIVLAMAMSPDLPILFRMALANMISFFMWHQVMMPRRVTFTVTIVTVWQTRIEVPLSAVRDYEVCQGCMSCFFTVIDGCSRHMN